jgi:AcrR family transcriptional regulator
MTDRMSAPNTKQQAPQPARSAKASPRRPRTDSAVTRGVILDAAEVLMVEEGYAAVTTRRVAERSGLKASLIHYHFKTLDEMFKALYRRAAEQSLQRHISALALDDPVTAMWQLNIDGERTALAIEFMALANHRKVIREEIARYAEQIRAIQVVTLDRYLGQTGRAAKPFSSLALSVILPGVARALVMEGGVGIRLGHAEARAAIKALMNSYLGGGNDTPAAAGPSLDLPHDGY